MARITDSTNEGVQSNISNNKVLLCCLGERGGLVEEHWTLNQEILGLIQTRSAVWCP